MYYLGTKSLASEINRYMTRKGVFMTRKGVFTLVPTSYYPASKLLYILPSSMFTNSQFVYFSDIDIAE